MPLLYLSPYAFELYGMLAGNVSPMTGENVKPAYGGEDEAFLRKLHGAKRVGQSIHNGGTMMI